MADYYSVIAYAVSRLPSKTDEAKRAIYERARAALRKALRSPFSETELVAEQAALEVAISMVEVINDIATTPSCDEGYTSVSKVLGRADCREYCKSTGVVSQKA
jgi:formiminotetrahydrofolate cyclodeaminase